jgi:hypothetical protein
LTSSNVVGSPKSISNQSWASGEPLVLPGEQQQRPEAGRAQVSGLVHRLRLAEGLQAQAIIMLHGELDGADAAVVGLGDAMDAAAIRLANS